jgi:hypothetical protein
LLDDPLGSVVAQREPSRSERRAFEALIDHHRTAQHERVTELAQRFGDGPTLRAVRRRIAEGKLLDSEALAGIAEGARRDHDAEAEREDLQRDFLAWRESEAKRRAKAQGLLARLRNRPDAFLTAIDSGSVRYCRRCEEIAVPDPERAERNAERHVAVRCHFCGGRAGEA